MNNSSIAPPRFAPRLCLALLTVAAGCVLLWHLDRPLLWQDEAETANVAVNILRTGLPTPWDGKHLVTQQQGHDSLRVGNRLLWAWHPWPQHYLAAAGLALAGEGAGEATRGDGLRSDSVRTRAARLPFALLGLVTVPLVYGWRRRRDGWGDALVTTTIYALSLGFVLYSRQCRYYALLYLGGLVALWAYGALGSRDDEASGDGRIRRPLDSVLGPRPGATLGLALGLALVFYANPLSGIALGAGLGVHSLTLARRRLGATIRAGALFALLAAPWLALVAASDVRAPSRDLGELVTLLAGQLWRVQYTLLPAVVWPVLAWIWWRSRRRRAEDGPKGSGEPGEEIALLAVLTTTMLVVVSLQAPIGTARYLLPLWPLCAVALARVWRWLHRRSVVMGVLYLIALLGTDLLPSLPATPVALARPGHSTYDREAPLLDKLAHNGRVGAPWLDFLAQQAAPPRGPIHTLVDLAHRLERPPRAAVASYGWESLHFYLRIPVVPPGLQTDAREHLDLPMLDPSTVDLVIPRRGWPQPDLQQLGSAFVPITLPTPDDAYENLPDPTGARFHPSDLPPLRVWVRTDLLSSGGRSLRSHSAD